MITVQSLESLTFDQIVTSFLEAFDGYYVKMPDDPEYYRDRWLASGLRYDLSFGAFYRNRLAGFVLHCVDQRDGQMVAFNTGTGVIPEFRGNHIVSRIYQHAIPELLSKGITMSRLEVIQHNFTAINIYKRTGFEITRYYKCFQGKLTTDSSPAAVKIIGFDEMDWGQVPNQQVQSWDHQRNSLKTGPYRFYRAFMESSPIGLIALNAPFKYMALCEITSGQPEHWDHLLAAVKQLSSVVKINNVDSRLTEKIEAFKRAGLQNNIDQYEMELALT